MKPTNDKKMDNHVTGVRVVKFDERNFGIQEYKQKESGEWHWVNAGYYGGKLSWALDAAVLMGMPTGEVKESLKLFKEAAQCVGVVEGRHEAE